MQVYYTHCEETEERKQDLTISVPVAALASPREGMLGSDAMVYACAAMMAADVCVCACACVRGRMRVCVYVCK